MIADQAISVRTSWIDRQENGNLTLVHLVDVEDADVDRSWAQEPWLGPEVVLTTGAEMNAYLDRDESWLIEIEVNRGARDGPDAAGRLITPVQGNTGGVKLMWRIRQGIC